MKTLQDINDISNQNKIALIVIGYNRLNGIERLLSSLNNALYPSCDIPLIISIDASGCRELYEYVEKFSWNHGELYVNIQDKRLGLKEHIFQCASLVRYFKAVTLFEDDLFVSPYFYGYVEQCLDRYGENSLVAGISLYSQEINGRTLVPFKPLNKGDDVYLWQDVASWGQVWNKRMWLGFLEWYQDWDKDFSKIKMPIYIKKWERAWSKYFYAYLVENHKYFVNPYVSLTTNFNDAGGEHGGCDDPFVQVPLLMGNKSYKMDEAENLVRYDIYQQNEQIYEWLGFSEDQLTIDLNGLHYIEGVYKRYILTTLILPYNVVMSFGMQMRPIELNIMYSIDGTGIYLYDTIERKRANNKNIFSTQFITYHLEGFSSKFILIQCKEIVKSFIKNKLKKILTKH